mmetsp:Transcript_30222/g.48451  ORF Transcript_30222/g.48451 Transcript_30222/m.48451 type:complete len:233 (-) Transcript_30222:595-1293(-)
MRQDTRKVVCALGEIGHLKCAHGSVPYHSLAIIQLVPQQRAGFGSMVESHVSIGDILHGDDVNLGVVVESVGDDHVYREDEFHALFGRPLLERSGHFKAIIFHDGVSDVEAPRLEERENHASSNNKFVALIEERLQHWNLGGNLCPSYHCSEWTTGILHRGVEEGDLFFQQYACDSGSIGIVCFDLGYHPSRGRVRPMCSSKGVVDVHLRICGRCKLFGKRLVVFRLPRMET